MRRRVGITEKNNSGTVTSTKQFLWCNNQICEERDANGNVTNRFYPQGEQIAGASYYYTKDHLGSTRELTNGSGQIQARYDYDPYGRTTLVSGSNLSDKQYAGMYMHQPSGLYLTKYRAYDSNSGKWLSRDPMKDVELSQGPNIYEYVENNPILNIDWFGLANGSHPKPEQQCPCGQHSVPRFDAEGAEAAGGYLTGDFAGPGGAYYGGAALALLSLVPPLTPVTVAIGIGIILESTLAGLTYRCEPN